MNIVSTWLFLIGTPERARKLLGNIDVLDGRQHKGCGGVVSEGRCRRCKTRQLVAADYYETLPRPCPARLMFDKQNQGWIYADPSLRPALDAWDEEVVSRNDIWNYAAFIARGEYDGQVYSSEAAGEKAAKAKQDAKVRLLQLRQAKVVHDPEWDGGEAYS